MAENYNKNSHKYKMPKLKDLVKGSGFVEIPKETSLKKRNHGKGLTPFLFFT